MAEVDYAPNWKPIDVFLPRQSPKERLTCVGCFRPFLRHEGAVEHQLILVPSKRLPSTGSKELAGRWGEALRCWDCGGYETGRKRA